MDKQHDALLLIIAQKHLADLRKEAAYQHLVDEARESRPNAQWRRQLGQSLVKLGQRLAQPEVSTAA